MNVYLRGSTYLSIGFYNVDTLINVNQNYRCILLDFSHLSDDYENLYKKFQTWPLKIEVMSRKVIVTTRLKLARGCCTHDFMIADIIKAIVLIYCNYGS